MLVIKHIKRQRPFGVVVISLHLAWYSKYETKGYMVSGRSAIAVEWKCDLKGCRIPPDSCPPRPSQRWPASHTGGTQSSHSCPARHMGIYYNIPKAHALNIVKRRYSVYKLPPIIYTKQYSPSLLCKNTDLTRYCQKWIPQVMRSLEYLQLIRSTILTAPFLRRRKILKSSQTRLTHLHIELQVLSSGLIATCNIIEKSIKTMQDSDGHIIWNKGLPLL